MKLSAVLEYVVILEHVLNTCRNWHVGSVQNLFIFFERNGLMTRVMITPARRFQPSGASLRMYQALRRKWEGIADRFLGFANGQVDRKERNGVLAKKLVIAYRADVRALEGP
jgi:hypothetical protein